MRAYGVRKRPDEVAVTVRTPEGRTVAEWGLFPAYNDDMWAVLRMMQRSLNKHGYETIGGFGRDHSAPQLTLTTVVTRKDVPLAYPSPDHRVALCACHVMQDTPDGPVPIVRTRGGDMSELTFTDKDA